LIPEIIGRLPILTYLKPLDKEALRNILTEPNNAITKQYKKLLEMDGYQLTFASDMLDYVVDKALEYKLGARGLRGLMETVMMDVMFDLPSSNSEEKRFEVTREYAAERIEKADLYAMSVQNKEL
jgi:ATP-dependent Clp protease ATP-binding subunit ClpX